MSILKKAQEIVYERSEEKTRQYGPVEQAFQRTARIATELCGKEITAQDVCRIQMAFKLSRESHSHKEDNLIDLVAYASILNDLEKPKSDQLVIHFSEEQIELIKQKYENPKH